MRNKKTPADRLCGLLIAASVFAIASCAGHSSRTDEDCGEHCEANGKVTVRRIAWMEGEVQTGYEPDRTVAEAKLKQTEASGKPDPNDTDKYLEYLSLLDSSGRSSQAETELKKYLSTHAKETRAIFLLGVHYMRLRKRELALHFFNQLEKDKNFGAKSLLYNNLGMLALQENNRALAIDYFEKATKESPATAAPFVNLGALYLQSRSYSDAQALFSRAHEIDEDFEDAVLGLGSSLEGQGKFQEAHEIYAAFIGGHSDALSVLYNDAEVLGNRLKNKQEASELMLRYIQRGGRESAKAHDAVQSWK